MEHDGKWFVYTGVFSNYWLDRGLGWKRLWTGKFEYFDHTGKRVARLPAGAYGGHKDVNEGWMAGALTIGAWSTAAAGSHEALVVPEDLQEGWEERATIMVYNGNLPRPEAEHLAWAGLSPHNAKR